jgi:hypothetical protein
MEASTQVSGNATSRELTTHTQLTVEQCPKKTLHVSLSQPVKPLSEEGRMKRLRWIAIISTTICALELFFLSNTALALLPVGPNGIRPPCVLVFEFPFTDYSFQLPLWMWGLVPFSALVLSALAAITSWVMLLFRWRAVTRLGGWRKPEVNS